MRYDVIIIGSGAGGAAAAYHLTQTGKRVLLLEKGEALPKDGSTLDTHTVMRLGTFLSKEAWIDRDNRIVVPEEHFNVGGKTKWYGAALLRFAPHEFESDEAHRCRPWPITYRDIEPFYEEAEALLGVRVFDVEPDFKRLVAALQRLDPAWRTRALQVGLSADIFDHPQELAHFDAFASVRGLKSDAESCLIDRVRGKTNLTMITGKPARALLPATDAPLRVAGVECEDGTRYEADTVLLAAGALHSPRLLQSYLERAGLDHSLPAYRNVGRNYKFHVLTALLAFSARAVNDALSKTALLLHERFPHSSVQTLGGTLARDIIDTQAPGFAPSFFVRQFSRRGVGLFLQTEDGSHIDNRIIAAAGWPPRPAIDHDPARLPEAHAEHRALVQTLRSQLLRLGYVAVTKAIPLSGTAHACGTLMTGNDPDASVVDAEGRVHGMENLYVVDGSVLPRSSRVNPALTIYAWGLRVASRLASRTSSRLMSAVMS